MALKLSLAELYRIAHSKMFYISLSVCFFLVLIINVFEVDFILFSRLEHPPVINLNAGAYRIYYSLGTAVNYLFMLLPFHILVYCRDFSNKVILNHIAGGIKRKSYFLSKLITINLLNSTIYLLSILISLAVCLLLFGSGLEEMASVYIVRLIITLIIHSMLISTLNSVYLALAVIIQNSVAWVSVYIFSIIISGSFFIAAEIYANKGVIVRMFPQYWLLASVNYQFFKARDYAEVLVVMLIYNLIAITLGLVVFNKKDIKG
jgi:ABC-type transport system involved in multi-copper enzyme maturation permease subunit